MRYRAAPGILGFLALGGLLCLGWAALAVAGNEPAGEKEAALFWAYQPPQKRLPSPPRDRTWARTDIDRFIRAKLETQRLRPVPPADRGTLLRRGYYDLIGLP